MSLEQQEFEQLLAAIREGSEDAVRRLLDRYGRHILTVIRQKLDVHLRSVFDSTDFLQDVWASFFAGDTKLSFRDPKALIKFLVNMARNKVTDMVRLRVAADKHNLMREQSLDGSARVEAAGLAAEVPAPSDLAMAREEWERLLEGRPLYQRQILELLRLGYTHGEIAAEMKLNEKTVRRLIHKISLRSRS